MHTLEKSVLFRVNLQDDVKVKVKLLSRVQLFVTPWTVACQAPLPMKFSRQEHWSGLPFPTSVNFHIDHVPCNFTELVY